MATIPEMRIDVNVFLNNKHVNSQNIKTRIGFFFLRLARKCLVIDMEAGIHDWSLPPNVFVATEYDGSQWVMLEDYKKLYEEKG